MAFRYFQLILAAMLPLYLPSVETKALTKSHRGIKPGTAAAATQLEYAQSPTSFLNSKGYDVIDENTVLKNRNNAHAQSPINAHHVPKSTASHSFTGALPYDKYNPGGTTNAGYGSQPTVTLYSNNNNPSHQPNSYNTYNHNTAIPNNAGLNSNHQQATTTTTKDKYRLPYTSHDEQLNSARNYFPKESKSQHQLNFDLFNSNNDRRHTPQFDQTPSSSASPSLSSYFGNNNSNFGRAGPGYVTPTPFTRNNPDRNIFNPQQRFPYDMSSNSHDQVTNQFNNYNNNNYNNNNPYSPILSQGFSLPTTYQGKQRTNISPKETFSTVTDPRTDKRVAISSYIPSNNFVNPTNFLIPTEDKYSMINRIFGGFQSPVEKQQQQHQQQQTQNTRNLQENNPYSIPSSTNNPYQNVNSGTNKNNNNKINTFTPNDQNIYGNNYYNNINNDNNKNNNIYNNQNTGYANHNTGKSQGGYQNNAATNPVSKDGQYFTGSKSMAKPGYGQGFQNQGAFSYTPTQSLSQPSDYNTQSVFGARNDPPTLLFSDFTYNNPLSVNQFRSKNLLGDANFGKTEYDNNRLTPNTLFENNNENYYKNADFFAPSDASQNSVKVSGTNGYEQVGGGAVTAGNSYDNSYKGNNGYTNSFDESDQKAGYAPAKQNYGYSDQSSNTDDYNNAARYSDGDGYSNSFGYSDGGNDSNYVATDDNNETGYQKAYQNIDDESDNDSYSDSKGYNREHYDGKNYDITDGYTDNVNYDADKNYQHHNHHHQQQPQPQPQDSNPDPYNSISSNSHNSHSDVDKATNYRQGLNKVSAALSTNGVPSVAPYVGLSKPVTADLPPHANYKPFDVNSPVVA